MRSAGRVILVLLLVLASAAPLFISAVPAARPLTKPVRYPTPAQAEPVIAGKPVKLVVEAGADASGWKLKLLDAYARAWAPLVNSTLSGSLWTVYFTVPSDLRPSLYDANIAFSSGGKATNYTQPRSAWILKEWPDSLSIAQITDLHLPYGADNVARFAYEANLLHPDIVVTTGDNADVETIASAWGYLQSILGRLEAPSFVIPGNHDHAGARGEFFQTYGGRLNYTVSVGKFLIIALDSGANGYLTMGDMAWAEKVLERNPDKVKVLLFHHPLLSRDEGTHTVDDPGGGITGDWTRSAELVDLMHLGWLNNVDGKYVPKPEATELLRMVQTYDVRLILNGHVHSDVIHVLNGKHWFVTTATIGGGVVPGNRQGYRVVTVDALGKVTLDPVAQKNTFNPPNNIPVGSLTYWYATPNDFSGTAVSGAVRNDLDVAMNVRLEYSVSNTKPVSDYRWSGALPSKVESTTVKDGLLYYGYFDVPAKTTIYSTLSTSLDTTKPVVTLTVPPTYEKDADVPVKVDVSDLGWGVKTVSVTYGFEHFSGLQPIPTVFSPTVSKDSVTLEYSTQSFALTIPKTSGYELTVRVDATDFAGNTQTITKTAAAPKPTPKHTFALGSTPDGVALTLNGAAKTTPAQLELDEGQYTVVAPAKATVSGKDYNFKSWSNGATTAEVKVTLAADTTLTATYEAAPAAGGGIPLPAEYAAIGVAAAAALLALRKRRAA